MAKNPQQEAEAELETALQKHLEAKEAQDEAEREHKSARKAAKQAAVNDTMRYFLLTHTNFNSWWEASALLLFPAVGWLLARDDYSDRGSLGILIGLGLGFAYLIYVCDTYGGVIARLLLARERGYLAGLPFAAEGYWPVISTRPAGDDARVLATLRFSEGSKPKKELVEGTMRKFQQGFYLGSDNPFKISWEEDQAAVTLRSHKLSTPRYGKKKPALRSTGELHTWAKTFLQQVAAPLHQAYPLEQVSFSLQ